MQLVSLTLIHWIVIYPVDSAIQLLNNWGQVFLWYWRYVVVYKVGLTFDILNKILNSDHSNESY